MLGDTHTGKTSLVLRFVEGYYRESKRTPTVGAFFLTKRLQSSSGVTCKIQIWDTAGQPQFRPLAPMYYKNAAAAVLCYDVGSRPSYDVVKYWLDELHRNVPAGSIVICICANKTDQKPYAVPHKEAIGLAHTMGAIWVETSAKNNHNVTELFQHVAEQVLRFQEHHRIPVTPGATVQNGDVVRQTEHHTVSTPTPSVPHSPSRHQTQHNPKQTQLSPYSRSAETVEHEYQSPVRDHRAFEGMIKNPPDSSFHQTQTRDDVGTKQHDEEKKQEDHPLEDNGELPRGLDDGVVEDKERRDKRTRAVSSKTDAPTKQDGQSVFDTYLCGTSDNTTGAMSNSCSIS